MPPVLPSAGLLDGHQAHRLTSYLAPLQRPPRATAGAVDDPIKPVSAPKDEMVFDRTEGTKIQQITDGTSNTILMLEAHPKSGVPWTKPDDLVLDQNDLFKDLRGQPNDGFCCNFGDGSAHFLKN